MEFLNLFDITVETSLLIVLIGAVNKLLKKKLDPNIRYFLWIFVAIRLLLPVRVELSVEVPDLFDTAIEHTHSSQITETETDAATAAWEPLPAFPVEYQAAVTPPQPHLPAGTETAPKRAAVSGKDVAQFVWILGVVGVSGYVLLCNRKVFRSFRKKRRKIEVLDNGIPLYAMPGYNCLAGIVSPAIYIDTDALGGPDVIRNVISHELQHYRVRDNYWQLLRVICLILQWHNPFMWWAYFASKRDCEMACDARVVRDMTSEERFGYGDSLLVAAESVCRKKQQAVACATSMGGNKAFMRERISEMMQYKRKRAVGLLAVIICIIGIGCFASFHLYASEEEDHNPVPESSAAAESVPEHQPEETLPHEEEITPVEIDIASYYITNTGNPSNLYYIDENNVLWGCGQNNCGQLGQGTQDYDFHEDMVKIAEHVIHVDYSQNDFMIYLTEDHKLYGVGNAGCGALQQYEAFDPMQYANREHYTVTTPCLLMENVVYARCGRSDVACMTEDSQIWVFGTIGFDTTETHYYQYPVKVLEDAAFVTGGFFSHAALLRDGSVWTWGYNYAGSCGVAGGGIVSEPTRVAEHVRMVWTGDPEYNVNCRNIADFGGVNKRQLENTIILTDDGEYLMCGVYVGTEEKILPIYYETWDYAVVCTHEFLPCYLRYIQIFTREEVAVVPEIREYDFQSAREAGTMWQIHGNLPGASEGTWYAISIDGVEYYYGQYDFQNKEDADYFGYAIFSDKYTLINGISVGMTMEEILDKYPNMAVENSGAHYLGKEELYDNLGWNPCAYPRSYEGMDKDWEYNGKDYFWTDQFDYIMLADVDQGTEDTLPVYIALLIKDNLVKAITFYYPTAG